MPYISAQPRVKEDLLASLLEQNASEYAVQQEWEAEWNQHGLASRLSEEVCVCVWGGGSLRVCIMYIRSAFG